MNNASGTTATRSLSGEYTVAFATTSNVTVTPRAQDVAERASLDLIRLVRAHWQEDFEPAGISSRFWPIHELSWEGDRMLTAWGHGRQRMVIYSDQPRGITLVMWGEELAPDLYPFVEAD